MIQVSYAFASSPISLVLSYRFLPPPCFSLGATCSSTLSSAGTASEPGGGASTRPSRDHCSGRVDQRFSVSPHTFAVQSAIEQTGLSMRK
jgi:hypothetical protein